MATNPNYAIVLDVSAVVWDPAHFEQNKTSYFTLKSELIQLIEKIEDERPRLLLRTELLSEMMAGFPFEQMPSSFSVFKNIVYSFLGKVASEIVQYKPTSETEVTSDPELLKSHYKPNLTQEVKYLINEIHTNNNRNNVYFTFKYLWPEHAVLHTKELTGPAKKHDTIIAGDSEQVTQFFNQFKKVFSHSPKHHDGKKQGDYESPLSCRDQNDVVPQQYLDSAIRAGKRFYAYDEDNDVFIVFHHTEGNIYHGHDEINVNKVPAKVRMELKKAKNG
ncbi:hypothetical protein [Mucilaginibacter sp. KACC 22063]|uniref:hypothetical protein n=1 Tax=Mucilaginibacter sp. KACC 22063 TaxID=3025666 RepID=UPI0023653B8C|nr:hypothetical protein [Mucilaginibacter sp. KACC 22063]WDF55774.1 hypothetical protein PQ461_01700 [Mucilaginibacter sp. KACC 22063]